MAIEAGTDPTLVVSNPDVELSDDAIEALAALLLAAVDADGTTGEGDH
jgi:hypothetical protein